MHQIDREAVVKWYWIVDKIPGDVRSIIRDVRGVEMSGNKSVNRVLGYAPPHSKGPGATVHTIARSALSRPLKFSIPPERVDRAALLAAMKDVLLDSAELKVVDDRMSLVTGSSIGGQRRKRAWCKSRGACIRSTGDFRRPDAHTENGKGSDRPIRESTATIRVRRSRQKVARQLARLEVGGTRGRTRGTFLERDSLGLYRHLHQLTAVNLTGNGVGSFYKFPESERLVANVGFHGEGLSQATLPPRWGVLPIGTGELSTD
jgi:hypothetical protein